MKNHTHNILFFLIFIISFYMVNYTIPKSVDIKNIGNIISFTFDDKTKDINNTSNNSIILNDVIKSDGNISNYYLSKIDKNYDKLPENIRDSFESNGWTIIVTEEDLKNKYNFKYNTEAVTDFAIKTIYINNKSNENVLFHEIGHFIDYMNNYFSNSEDFINAYNSELDSFLSLSNVNKYNTNTTIEYFAESYRQFIIDNANLKNKCPLTYYFVDIYVNKI